MSAHKRTWSERPVWALIQMSVFSAVLLTLVSCQRVFPVRGPALPTSDPQVQENVFRSDPFHLEATLPAGWVGVEGPESLARPFSGLVAFNSWGEPGFWARAIEQKTAEGSSSTYSPQSTLSQLPEDGAYVVLVWWSGGPIQSPEAYGPEHKSGDLEGLWSPEDCREVGVYWNDFFKWGRNLRLEVYCGTRASEHTSNQVNTILASWRFDPVPIGDIGWATVTARNLLPAEVAPMRFPFMTHTESSTWDGAVVRTTTAEVQDEIVRVTFIYRWDEPEHSIQPGAACPPERCHWWLIEARADGRLVLVDEGGAELP